MFDLDGEEADGGCLVSGGEVDEDDEELLPFAPGHVHDVVSMIIIDHYAVADAFVVSLI